MNKIKEFFINIGRNIKAKPFKFVGFCFLFLTVLAILVYSFVSPVVLGNKSVTSAYAAVDECPIVPVPDTPIHDTPKKDTPDVTVPDVNVPNVDTPNVTVPDVDVPNIDIPSGIYPDYDIPIVPSAPTPSVPEPDSVISPLLPSLNSSLTYSSFSVNSFFPKTNLNVSELPTFSLTPSAPAFSFSYFNGTLNYINSGYRIILGAESSFLYRLYFYSVTSSTAANYLVIEINTSGSSYLISSIRAKAASSSELVDVDRVFFQPNINLLSVTDSNYLLLLNFFYNMSFYNRHNYYYQLGWNSSWDIAYENGYNSGYDYGWGEGHALGWMDGVDIARDTYFNKGVELGYKQGYSDAYLASFALGYQSGYKDNYQAAYDRGFKFAYDLGYQSAWNLGYNSGYYDSYESNYNASFCDGYMWAYRELDIDSYYQQGFDTGFNQGKAAGRNEALTEGLTNPISFMINPVVTFFDTKLFGVVSIGSILSVALFVAVAIIFLKMFAGG